MAHTNLYTVGLASVTGSGAFNLIQIQDGRIDPGLQNFVAHGAAQPNPSWSGMRSAQPMYSCTTTELERLFDNIDHETGLAIPQTTVITGLDAYFVRYAQAGQRMSGSNHVKCTIANGMAVPTQLSAQHRGDAQCGLDVHAISSDGTTAPIIIADSQALPATAEVDELFSQGPGWINGTQIAGLVGITIDFGHAVMKDAADSRLYPTRVHSDYSPLITLQTKEVLDLSTFGIAGTAQGGTASDLYLIKRALTGGYEAITSTVHIRIRINTNQGYIWVEDRGGGNNQMAAGAIKIQPIVGAAEILTITTGVAIPAFT